MQDNQQVQRKWSGDLGIGNPNIQYHGTPQEIIHCNVMQIAFTNAKKVADQLHNIDPENDLWRKMLFQVPFVWIRENLIQFQSELQ